jgi:hypothetical protein
MLYDVVKFCLNKGPNIGTLTLNAIRNTQSGNDLNNTISIFSLTGTQMAKWIGKNIRIEPEDIGYDFKLTIDGIVGSGYGGIHIFIK